MNILIMNADSTPQHTGGIKRVSSILAHQWVKMGHAVRFMMGHYNGSGFENIGEIKQEKLPCLDIESKENLAFLSRFISDNKIDILLNQHGEDDEICRLCAKVRSMTGVKLITSWHFSAHYDIDEKDAYFLWAPISKGIRGFLSAIKWRFIDRRGRLTIRNANFDISLKILIDLFSYQNHFCQ